MSLRKRLETLEEDAGLRPDPLVILTITVTGGGPPEDRPLREDEVAPGVTAVLIGGDEVSRRRALAGLRREYRAKRKAEAASDGAGQGT